MLELGAKGGHLFLCISDMLPYVLESKIIKNKKKALLSLSPSSTLSLL